MALAILDELARKLVHQQSPWSESLILSKDEAQSLANVKCRRMGSLLQGLSRCLSVYHHAEANVVVVELIA